MLDNSIDIIEQLKTLRFACEQQMTQAQAKFELYETEEYRVRAVQYAKAEAFIIDAFSSLERLLQPNEY